MTDMITLVIKEILVINIKHQSSTLVINIKTVAINILNINKDFKENINIVMREVEGTKRN